MLGQCKPKFSITQQIEEVEREIALRNKVYPGLIRRGEMRQTVADYHTARMQAVLDTLQWLSANRTRVLEEVKKEAQNKPAADAA